MTWGYTTGLGIDEMFGQFSGEQPSDAEGRSVCAGCGQGHAQHVTDLRPWPPDKRGALKYCGACRFARAVKDPRCDDVGGA